MTRAEAHARALRAVTRVTFTIGLVGCAEDAPPIEPAPISDDALAEAEGAADAGPEDPEADLAGFFVDAAVDADALPPDDAAPPDAIDGAVLDGALADGGPAMCDPNATDYSECCEAVGWDPEHGCTPWGPPTPPAMLS